MATRWIGRREEAQNQAAIYFTAIQSNRNGMGAAVTVIAGGHKFVQKCGSGSSYISNNNDGRLHFGLGKQWRGRWHQDSLAKRQQREVSGGKRPSFFITLIESRSGTPHGW
jgi:ASPIC and UnbV